MIYLHLEDGDVIVFDGVLKDAHTATAQITEFPLEDGSFVNDHTILKPKTLKISVGEEKKDNPSEIYDTMVSLRDKRVLMDIQTHLKLYENFLLESVEPVRDASVGDLVMFSINFKEVKFATSKQVKIERKSLPTKEVADKLASPRARGEVNHKVTEVETKKSYELNLTDDAKQSVKVEKLEADVGYNSLMSSWFLGVGEDGEKDFNGIKVTPNKNLVGFIDEKKSVVAVTDKAQLQREDLKDATVVYTPDGGP